MIDNNKFETTLDIFLKKYFSQIKFRQHYKLNFYQMAFNSNFFFFCSRAPAGLNGTTGLIVPSHVEVDLECELEFV